jgi:anhydro-N-acetylmuramic acid kinase
LFKIAKNNPFDPCLRILHNFFAIILQIRQLNSHLPMIIPHNTALPLQVIGLMSGTSLDGVDLAACNFSEKEGKWTYDLIAADTIPYPAEWEEKLKNLQHCTGEELAFTNAALGRYYGSLIRDFIAKHKLKPELTGSHGHTVFHQPQHGFTLQIGDPSCIATLSGIDTVGDFRTGDIALGGQGAPLVPIGDRLLFGDYKACLNLGGIANISFEENNKRIAFDVCPVNMALNLLANSVGKAYDDGGAMARSGKLIPELFDKLNQLDFYKISGPRSLGREWFETQCLPLIHDSKSPLEDRLFTFCEHIAEQHARVLDHLNKTGKILVTGGGAFNSFLIERIKYRSGHPLEVPRGDLINYKEAIVFAFLAMLFVSGRVNVLSSATGAMKDHIGGAFYRSE